MKKGQVTQEGKQKQHAFKKQNEQLFEKMDKSLHEYLFKQREDNFEHATYSQEMATVQPVKDGDLKAVARIVKSHKNFNLPSLSFSPLQSRKFLFVADVTMVCRFCIEGGMPSSESYGLSDLYIRKTDQCRTEEDVEDLYGEMMMDYAKRMHAYRQQIKDLSPKVLLAVNYIENHLHERIKVADIAEDLEMNAAYLSTLFAKEMGRSVSAYIRDRKHQVAKYLLTYEEYSCTDIAEYLGYSGESHFSALFSAREGLSPTEYRKREYRKHFETIAGGGR